MADALASAYSELFDRVLATQAAALEIAQALATDPAGRNIDQLLRLLPELLTPVERLPFNQPLSGPRRVAWTTIPIPEMNHPPGLRRHAQRRRAHRAHRSHPALRETPRRVP
jgi:hypothetical protein